MFIIKFLWPAHGTEVVAFFWGGGGILSVIQSFNNFHKEPDVEIHLYIWYIVWNIIVRYADSNMHKWKSQYLKNLCLDDPKFTIGCNKETGLKKGVILLGTSGSTSNHHMQIQLTQMKN